VNRVLAPKPAVLFPLELLPRFGDVGSSFVLVAIVVRRT
jgi:hypothetical protein